MEQSSDNLETNKIEAVVEPEDLKENENSTKLISITIPKSLYDQLQEHKEINRSQLFRDAALFALGKEHHHVPSLIYFVSVMGFVFSISLIGISVYDSPITDYIRGLLGLLGGLLALSTAILYYKERKKVSQ